MLATVSSGAVIVVALISAIVGPSVLAFFTGRQRANEKKLDWARQDEVAAQAAKAATALVEGQKEAAELLVVANERVAEAAESTSAKLDVIHTLVNSNMTAAMQAELDATVREVAMMKEVIRLNQVAGSKPSADARATLKATEEKISELKATLSDRLKQTKVAEAQAGGG